MEHQRIDIPLNYPVRSLCWNGDSLIDWAGGNRVFHLNGKVENIKVNWAYKFDAAVQSPSGRFAAIYERLGTKALILDHGKFVREINRSFYHAHVYEYPIVLFQHDDRRELIAHCPEQYNRLEIEEITTGKSLTDCDNRAPDDFFHSRLAVSPGNKRLLGAGWVWHPFDTVCTWKIEESLANPKALDKAAPPNRVVHDEINNATFMDDDRLLLNSNPVSDDLEEEQDSPFSSGCLAIFNLNTAVFELIVSVEETIGAMLWLGSNCTVGFYEMPKIIDLTTGNVVFRWPDISTGKQDSSIIHHVSPLPPIALDPSRKRFAVASKDRISVIQF